MLWHMLDEEYAMETRKVSLFRNGRSQALRIPKEFELPGKEAVIRKEGQRLILEPVKGPKSLVAYLATLEPIEDAFPEIEDLPVKDVRI
jgi:antitoxin VapB